MKSVEEILTSRVTCRRYEREKLTDEQREAIFAAVRNTPTSFNAQNYTVIYIDDQETKEKLYDIVGQKQIKTCAAFMVFCIDFNKLKVGAEAKGLEMPKVYDTVDGLVDGTINASLALMSALVTAESLGLGTCPIGYVRTANPAAVAGLLRLPQHVTMVCGLAIGVPREHNDLKPKQPEALIFHHNGYRQDNLAHDIIDYDKVVTNYNATRAGDTTINDWVGHMVNYYHEMYGLQMKEALKARGFDINH